MKNSKVNFPTITLLIALLAFGQLAFAQNAKPRKSPKASVMQRIGADTDVVIDYSRPGVKGRTVWGDMIPYGMNPGNKYSKDKPYPWRAGADENTTITFTKDVTINGKKIAAGKYGLHMLPGKSEFKVMFNTVNDSWGSYAYDASKDALVISVKPEKCEHTEWLEFGFEGLSATGATVFLKWEEVKIPFKVAL